jgi:hypothetical protein
VFRAKVCYETKIASVTIQPHNMRQPLLQYTVTRETERHFVFFLVLLKLKVSYAFNCKGVASTEQKVVKTVSLYPLLLIDKMTM